MVEEPRKGVVNDVRVGLPHRHSGAVRWAMNLIKASPTLRTLLLAGVALVMAAVWAGGRFEQLAQAYNEAQDVANATDKSSVDRTPTGSIKKAAPLAPPAAATKP